MTQASRGSSQCQSIGRSAHAKPRSSATWLAWVDCPLFPSLSSIKSSTFSACAPVVPSSSLFQSRPDAIETCNDIPHACRLAALAQFACPMSCECAQPTAVRGDLWHRDRGPSNAGHGDRYGESMRQHVEVYSLLLTCARFGALRGTILSVLPALERGMHCPTGGWINCTRSSSPATCTMATARSSGPSAWHGRQSSAPSVIRATNSASQH